VRVLEFSYKIFGRVLEELSSLPRSGQANRADNTSSYSDLLQWRIHPELMKSAKTVRLTVIAMSFLGLNPDQEETLKKQILKVCHKFNHEGEWERVREIVTLSNFTPAFVLQEHLRDRNSEEFFGNDLRTLRRIWQHGLRTYDPYAPNRNKVKTPQRKRGYDDKGHLPLSRSGLGNTTRLIPAPAKDPVEEPSITNTLWHSDLPSERKEKEQGTIMENTTSRTKLNQLKLF
jgi:hypothetical protein